MFEAKDKKKEIPPEGKETFTFLARGFEFKGTLTFEGTVRIDGSVAGEIRSSGTIILGEHAIIEGDVSADVVISGGRVTGNIIAKEKVQLLSTGIVLGTIKTPLLSVEEGVRFMGNCEAVGRGEVRTLEGARETVQQPQQGVARARGA